MANRTKVTKKQIDLATGVVLGHIIYDAMNDLTDMIIADELRWITIHPNGKNHKGRACKKVTKKQIDLATGVVLGHIIYDAMNDLTDMIIADELRWITIHPNGKNHKGRACKIDPKTGQIKGGNLPQRFFNKPLDKAFKQADNSEDIHYFALQENSLPQQSNVRFTLKPKTLTPEELKAATIQGSQILKANPLPELFASQKQGIEHIQALLPYTPLYLDCLPTDSLQCIAYAIHIAAEDFPHILTTSVYEFGHFDHKYNEFQKQKTQRMAIIDQLNNDKEWKGRVTAKLNAKLSEIKSGLEQLPDVKKLPYLCWIAKTIGKSKDWVEGLKNNDVFFKEFSKMSLKIARDEELKQRLENAGLISTVPHSLQKYIAAFEVNTKSITLNSKHFYCLGDLFLINEYEKSVTSGRLSKLKSGVNIKTAIVLHELMHALDYSYSLGAESLSDLKYFHEMFDNAKSEEYNQTNHRFDNIHEFFADSMVEYYLCEKRNQSSISVHDKAKKLFTLH